MLGGVGKLGNFAKSGVTTLARSTSQGIKDLGEGKSPTATRTKPSKELSNEFNNSSSKDIENPNSSIVRK